MDYDLYFYPFIRSFGLSVAAILLIIWSLKKSKVQEESRKSQRHIHVAKVSRLGGVAIFVGFFFSLLADQNLIISDLLQTVISISFLVILFGIWDDFYELDWKIQLTFQVLIALAVFFAGARIDYITNPLGGVFQLNLLFGLLLSIFWIVLFINSMNWLDGIDGLSGGVTLIAAVAIFILALKPEVNQPPMGIISLALAGAAAGFLVFNFHPAKILAGTSGAMFMGFILAVLAIFSGTKIATALMVMLIPVIDLIWVIAERAKAGVPIFKPDQRHLHHKLLKLGWSQRRIALFLYVATVLIAIVALSAGVQEKIFAILAVTVAMLAVLLVVNKKLAMQRAE